MKKNIFILLVTLIGFSTLAAQNINSNYLLYIEEFHKLAQKQQEKYKIPASITLAQGLIESGAGRSELAMQSKNHFGIKCHDWNGKAVYHDDDEAQECFRKYSNVLDSYEDHSLFLTSKPRYKELFLLRPDDYISWAHGLKKAGYATDPSYAFKLIEVIERYELYKYDRSGVLAAAKSHDERETYRANGTKFIVANENDSYESLAIHYNISVEKLRNFNDVGPNSSLNVGQIVYLKKKQRRVMFGNSVHVVQEGDTYYTIAQLHGIQLLSLYNMNKMKADARAYVGQVLKLR